MWRKILRAVFLLLFILAIGAGVFLAWLTSASFDRFVAGRIARELAKLNIRAEMGQVDVHPFDLSVEIRRMRLFAGAASAPFFELAGLDAEMKILDLLSRRFELQRLRLSEPTINLFVDDQGRSNLADIDLTSLKERPAGETEIEIGHIAIEGGALVFNHQPSRLSGEARHLEIQIRPESETTGVTLKAREVYVSLNDQRLDAASVEINTTVNTQGASIERARVVTPFADAVVSGTVRNWSNPEYEFSLASTLNLSRLTMEIKSGVSLTGTAELTGRVTGQGKDFRVTGNLASPKLGVGGVELMAFRFEAQGGTAGAVSTASHNDPDAFWLRGLLQSSRIRPGLVDLTDFRGAVFITPERIDISRFSATTLQGRVAGDAAIAVAGTSSVDAVFQSVDLHQAVAHIARREFPVAGTVSGEARFQWPATDFKQLTGHARVNIESPTSEMGEFLPTSGTATVAINRRGFNVTDANITIGTAQAEVTGWIAWNQSLDLHVDATFNNLTEEERFLAALEIDLSKLTRGTVTSLSGSGSFSGHIQGRGQQVNLSGAGTIRDLNLASGKLTSGRAEIEYRDRVVTLTNATAVFDDGSRATVALFRDELGVENGITLQGQFQQIRLSQWWDRLDFSLPITGQATGDFDLTGLPGAPRGQADFTVVQGRVQPPQFTVAFDRLTASFLASEQGYELRQVRLERGPNVITFSGSYQPQTREYSLTARGLDLDVSQFDDEMENRGYPLTGRLNLQISGAGKLAQPEFNGQFQLAQLTIAGKEAGTISGEVNARRGDIRWNVNAVLFGQQQVITGRLDLNDPVQPLTLRADLNQFQASPYLQLFLGTPADLGLILSGQVDLSWPLVFPERRRVTATLPQAQVNFENYVLSNENPLTIKLAGSRMEVSEVRFRGDNTDVKIGGRVDFPPVVEGESPLPQAQLNLAAEGAVNLQIASAFYAGLFTGGLARVQITIRGSLKDPNVSGIADIEQASARLLNFPVALLDGQGRVRFTENRLLLERFVGKANDGEVRIDGGLLADNFALQRWQFNIRATSIVVRYPEGWRSVLDGELALRGSRQLQILSGFLNVRQADYTRDIDLAELVLRGQSVLTGRAGMTAPTQSALVLDIRVQATDAISIRNNLATAQASAWLHVGGTLAEPLISGRATVTRGTLELRDREYDITVAAFDFPGRPNQEIRFNVEAQADISGYQVTIGFSGTPSRFKPTLRAEPPLPPEAVISLITTGRADTINLQTQALAQSSLGIATSLISEALSQQLEQRIARQRFFGINRFQVEPLLVGRGSDPTARITVGQQITKNLSITYSVNVATNDEPIVILEYKLSNRFYLVGARDERGEFSVDFRIRKRF